MDQLRRVLNTIQVSLSKLTTTQQLLIGSLVIVMLMTLFVVKQYAGKPELVPLLPGATEQDQEAALRFLQTSNYPYETGIGGVRVPARMQRTIVAQLAQQGGLPSDNTTLFDNLIDKQSWTMSQQQNQQLATIAVQNELNRIISNFKGIRTANVILNLPERRSLGSPATEPTASATVFPVGSLDQATVDSIASLVASSRGIAIERVRVIDGANNRQWKPKSTNELTATNALELLVAIEERKRNQLYELLSSYIKGVVVTVTAQVDVKQVRRVTDSVLQEGRGSWNPVTRETSREMADGQPRVGGEPGARSNNGADIAGFSFTGAQSFSESTADAEYQPMPGRESETIFDPRGNATKINAVVNIPRSYFVRVWQIQQGDDARDESGALRPPNETELEPIRIAEIERIRRDVEKLIDTSASVDAVQGEVEVSMIPELILETDAVLTAGASMFGLGGVDLGGYEAIVKTIGLGLFALVAMALLVMTAMRASKREPLPSAQELVGVPPALQSDSDLVGEAIEADSQLEGLELTDDEMRYRKLLEQVSDLINERPGDAAGMVGKWIANTG